MSGGGGSQPAQPSTTTQIQDIPEWEQGYVTDLLGRAQTISNQPYQQFGGPQVAGFTPDQLQAFQNIEGQTGANMQNQQDAAAQIMQGADSANNIYGAGAGNVNASTAYNPLAAVAPYLGASAGYNSAAAASPWLQQAAGFEGAAANAGTPQGIQSYMSPYTNNVVQGIQNQANQNWSQNIMPGINDKFVGSGQYGSGRNAQVLGQAAGNFQTGLSANVANALESGYNTAGTQAQNQANLLSGLGGQSLTGANTASGAQGAQVSNLLNQAQAAGTATQQQANNLQNAGTALGNLQATQGASQVAAGNALGNLGAQQAQTNLAQNTALQAAGQQQQQLNQTNLTTAMNDFNNQVNYPAQQTEYLNQIIRGLPAPTATTSSTQATPAYSVSPLSGVGGSLAAAAAGLTSHKRGGLIKEYAAGGVVTAGDDEDYVPLDAAMGEDTPAQPVVLSSDSGTPLDGVNDVYVYGDGSDPDVAMQQNADNGGAPSGNNTPMPVQSPLAQVSTPQTKVKSANPLDTPDSQHNAKNPNDVAMPTAALTQGDMQQQQLLALARGLLTPSLGGSTSAAFGKGLGNVQELQSEQRRQQIAQANLAAERSIQNARLGIEQQNADTNKQYKNARLKQFADSAASGGKGSVAQWKYNTWLEAHPDDTEGAMAYASGHKTMDDTAINKNALTMASNDKLGIDPDGTMTPVEKIAAYKSLLKNGTLPPAVVKAKPKGFFESLFGASDKPSDSAPEEMVPVFDSKGNPGRIPASKLEAAKVSGYKER